MAKKEKITLKADNKDYKDIILGELKKMEKLQKLEYRSKATKKEA